MNKRSVLFVLCSFVFATAGSGFAAPPLMASLKGSYESSLKALTENDATADCLAAYAKRLDSIFEAQRKAGDLNAVIAIRDEKKRLETEKNVPAESAADINPAIASARTEYHQAAAKAEVDKNKKILALADGYAANLETLKKQLTQQNKIEEATEVKTEIDRLRASPEVTSAQFVIADLASRQPRVATATKPPHAAPDPSGTPATTPSTGLTSKPSKYVRRVDAKGDSGYGWTKTTQMIKKGDTVTITAKGSWRCGAYYSACGPDGYGGGGSGSSYYYSYYGSRQLQSAPFGSLLCRIGESGEVRLVGASLTFTSDEDGVLCLDSNVSPGRSSRGGCGGSIAVTVEVVKKSN